MSEDTIVLKRQKKNLMNNILIPNCLVFLRLISKCEENACVGIHDDDISFPSHKTKVRTRHLPLFKLKGTGF